MEHHADRHSQQIEVVKEVIFTLIPDKDSTPYDFLTTINEHRSKPYFVVTKIITSEGLNLLQESIDKGRLSFLPVFVQIGWWKILSQQRVPETSPNIHKGRTAKQIAETKRAKKPLDEFNNNNEWENSLSPLMKSIRSGDLSKTNQILQNAGEEIFYCDYNNGNALYWAVVVGNVKLFRQLLEAGIDPGVRTKRRESLLHVACCLGQHMMIEVIVKRCHIDPSLEDVGHKTAPERVSENGDVQTVKELIRCNVQPGPNCCVLGAYSGRKMFVTYCIETLKMDKNSKDMYSRTPLHRACEGAKIDIVKYLIQLGADVAVTTCTLRNLLHIIAEQGSAELMSLIISVYKQRKILAKMINQQDRFTGVELCFLIRGRDKGRDAYHYVQVVRSKVPIFLKNTKAGNVDVAVYGDVIKSGWGVNPDQDVVDEIEDTFKHKRLDQNQPRDVTPLHIALFKGQFEAAKILVENGADVNARDNFGNTPLMLAASKGHKESVTLLEKSGAIYNDVNNDHKSAADIADENEHDEVVNMLKGREHDRVVQTFMSGNVSSLENKLSTDTLDNVRRQGGDVRRHLIDTLRDFRIDINQVLLDIGSGPVLEATEDN